MQRIRAGQLAVMIAMLAGLPVVAAAQQASFAVGRGWMGDEGVGTSTSWLDGGLTLSGTVDLPLGESWRFEVAGNFWQHGGRRFLSAIPMLTLKPTTVPVLSLSAGIGVGFRRDFYLTIPECVGQCGGYRYQGDWAGGLALTATPWRDPTIRPFIEVRLITRLGALGEQPFGDRDYTLRSLAVGVRVGR